MNELLSGLPEALPLEQECALALQIQKYQKEEDLNALVLPAMKEMVLYAGKCCRGRVAADELFSLVYAALMKAAPRFKPGQLPFKAYVKADVRGELARYWKKQNLVHNAYLHESEEIPASVQRAPQEDSSDGVLGTTAQREDAWAEPEFDVIALRERWALVKPIIERICNERERTILVLVYDAGFSFEQIATMVVPRVCREAIRATHIRALKKIRNELFRTKRLFA